jgi:hypothetical protein
MSARVSSICSAGHSRQYDRLRMSALANLPKSKRLVR